MARFQKKGNQLTGDETVDPRDDNFHRTSNLSPARIKTDLLRESIRDNLRPLKPEWLERSTSRKYDGVTREILSNGP
jgi:hypothetical protein